MGAASPSNAGYARTSRQRERHMQSHKAKRENVPFSELYVPFETCKSETKCPI